MNNKTRSCAIIITYNKVPNLEQINYHLLIDELNCLIVVDNSSRNDLLLGIRSQFLDELSHKYKLIENNENLGISRAMNKALRIAMEEGYEYIYFLDDDANLSCDHFTELRSEYDLLLKKGEKVGIVCPIVSNKSQQLNKTVGSKNLTEIKKAITSGMLISKNTLKKCGAYNESFFLEWADIEFCIRVRSCGLKIFRLNKVLVVQDFGITIKSIKPSLVPLFLYNKFFNFVFFRLGIVNAVYNHLSIYPPQRTKNINAEYIKIIDREPGGSIVKYIRRILHRVLVISKSILLFIGTRDILYIKNN